MERKRFICVLLALVLSFAGIVIFLRLQVGGRITSMQAELSTKRAEITSVEHFAGRKGAKEAADHQKRREDAALRALPARQEAGSAAMELQKAAAASGMKILSIKPEKDYIDGSSSALPMRVESSGGYFALLDFLDGLEHGARFVRISAMTVKQENGQVIASFTATFYSVAGA